MDIRCDHMGAHDHDHDHSIHDAYTWDQMITNMITVLTMGAWCDHVRPCKSRVHKYGHFVADGRIHSVRSLS